MKKINSIGYGGKILACSAVFALVIPAVIKIITLFYPSTVLKNSMKISFVIGCLIFIFLIALLCIELHQDKKINSYYQTKKNQKIHIGNNEYECQSCGNRLVKIEDTNCNVCGVLFNGDENDYK